MLAASIFLFYAGMEMNAIHVKEIDNPSSNFVLSFVPPSQISVGSPTTYVLILIAGNLSFVAIPLIIYAVRKPHWKNAEDAADFEPFGWELEGRHPGAVQKQALAAESAA